MKHLVLICAVLFAACSKKEDSKPAADNAAPAAEAKAAEAPAKTGGPVKTEPQALFDEFTKPGTDGMALIDKYHDGATISAKVVVKGHEEDGKPILWVELAGGKHISLDYTDVAKAKAIKDGDTVTATCKVGGAMDNLMMLIECT
jgi:hypothetical protein